jgi:hypothetical protein
MLFIILYPVNGNRLGFLLLLGLTMDVFSNSGGVHAALSELISGLLYLNFHLELVTNTKP